MQYLCMKLAQYIDYLIRTVDTDGFSTRASVTAVLSTHSWVCRRLRFKDVPLNDLIYTTIFI